MLYIITVSTGSRTGSNKTALITLRKKKIRSSQVAQYLGSTHEKTRLPVSAWCKHVWSLPGMHFCWKRIDPLFSVSGHLAYVRVYMVSPPIFPLFALRRPRRWCGVWSPNLGYGPFNTYSVTCPKHVSIERLFPFVPVGAPLVRQRMYESDLSDAQCKTWTHPILIFSDVNRVY